MAIPDYKKYLAENVLNERRPVTYRSLGRALRVHSTIAKQMLYDFHRHENAKKPHSVNATYILTGKPKAPEPTTLNGKHDETDSIPPSSPYFDSSMPNQDAAEAEIPVSSVLLVREEDLKDAKASFESLSSIYVYSLQPTVLQDLNALTDVDREMLVNYAKDDPLEFGKQWGMIQNKNVKRRTGAQPPPPPPFPSSSIPAKRPAQSEPSQSKSETKKEEPLEPPKPVQRQSSSLSAKSTEKAPPAKKEKGSLFSSFAKTKPKLKKEESSTPAASGTESAEPSGPEDVMLDDASEEESEELFPESKKQGTGETRESRKEREEKLKKMMEDDDEDEEMLDATLSEEPTPTIDQPPPKQEDLKVQATVQGGRRRGRRQVMKKAVKKDSEGYLVTVEEPSWESFSEDEPAPPPPKKKPAINAPKAKPGAKAGQGNIMSFFGKK
ncbi:hypothetical protein BDV12DRAFT_164826 [Aspergillus spectabilis]